MSCQTSSWPLLLAASTALPLWRTASTSSMPLLQSGRDMRLFDPSGNHCHRDNHHILHLALPLVPGFLHLAVCSWLSEPGCLHLAFCTWLSAVGCLQLAVCSWLSAAGCLHLAFCTWLSAVGCLQLAVCSWLSAAGCLQLAVCLGWEYQRPAASPPPFKGTVSRDFLLLVFFHESVSPKPLSIP